MAFDRNAINTGRMIQDFGLCDLKGAYQHTSRLRAKGFLVVAFLEPLDPISTSAIETVQQWTSVSDRIAIVAVVQGERPDIENWAAKIGASVPVLWDIEGYIAIQWAVSATPAVFVVNGQGKVLCRVSGNDATALSAARDLLTKEVAKAEAAAKAAAEAKAAADAKPKVAA